MWCNMINLFVTIAGIVIVINTIYVIFPGEKYDRYCKTVVGLISLISIFNVFTGDKFFDFPDNANIYASFDDNRYAFDDLVEMDLESKTKDTLSEKFPDVIEKADITYDGNEIREVIIYVKDTSCAEEIKNTVSSFLDINFEKVMVKYI